MRCEVYELQDVPYSTMAWVCGTLTNNLLTLMPQRLDDRIRELCAQAVTTNDSAELHNILKELRAAIHEHIKRLRKLAARYPIPPERQAM